MNRLFSFVTESGSVYEVADADEFQRVHPAQYIRRSSKIATEKRGDGLWIRLYDMDPKRPIAGLPVHMTLESLAPFGLDDSGNPEPDPKVTYRTTTLVTTIEEHA